MIKIILVGLLICSQLFAKPGGRPALVEVKEVTQGFINPLSKTIGTVEFEENSK